MAAVLVVVVLLLLAMLAVLILMLLDEHQREPALQLTVEVRQALIGLIITCTL